MKLETITLKNFRCFGSDPTTVHFENQVTAFVGGNGSGKTALFQALSRLFGPTASQRGVNPKDFHIGPDDAELQSGVLLFIDCTFSFPELESVGEEEEADAVPEFFTHMAASAPGEPLKARLRLQATWEDDGTPEGTVDEKVRWINTLDDQFEWDTCQNVSAVERGSIQLVYVPAVRNPSDRVTSLLKGRLWKAAQWSQALERSASRAGNLIQQRFEREEPSKFIVDRLARRWNQVHEADTDTTPILRLVDDRLEQLVRRSEFAFYPDEAGQSRTLDDLSDGQRSLFHIVLTAATLETEQEVLALSAEESPFDQEKLRRVYLTILAIEEPENSLSPFFLSRIINQARDIGGLTAGQTLVSSHSASILGRIEPEEVRYFRFQPRTRSSSVRSLTLPEDNDEASKYVRLAVKAYPELYFARFVIVAEGESERIVVPRVAEAMGIELDISFVPTVPLAGRFTDNFWALLTNLGIPFATLLDLDLGRQHGGATTIQRAVGNLEAVGCDLRRTMSYITDEFDPQEVGELEDSDLLESGANNGWIKALREQGVFFSHPIDLDFSMLAAFPEAYQHPHDGGRGPRDNIEEKKGVTLKTNGTPGLYSSDWDACFQWYPYLFLSRSKPEAHISALNRIEDESVAENAPEEIRALLKYVQNTLYPGLGRS